MLSIKKLKSESSNTSYDFSVVYSGESDATNLLGLISLSSKKASDLSRAIGIVSDFVVGKFEEDDQPNLTKLNTLQKETFDLISAVPIDDDDEIDFYLGLLSIKGDTFYVCFEQSYFNIYIIRNGKRIWVNKDSQTLMFVGSGKLMDNDCIYFTTKKLDINELIENEDYEIDDGACIFLKYSVQKSKKAAAEPVTIRKVIDQSQIEEELEHAIENPKPLEEEKPIYLEDIVPIKPKTDYRAKFQDVIQNAKPFILNLKTKIEPVSRAIGTVLIDTSKVALDFFLIKVLKIKNPSVIRQDKFANSRAKIGFVFIIVFVLVACFLIFKSIGDNSKEQSRKKEYESLIKTLDDETAQLSSNATPLNFSALTAVDEIQKNIDKAKDKTYAKYKDDSKLNSYQDLIAQSEDKINAVKKVANEDILTAITAKYPKAKPVSMTLLKNDSLVALDASQKALYLIDTKSSLNISQILIDSFQDPKYVASIDNRVFVYDTAGLFEVDTDNKSAKSIPGFTSLGDVKDFSSFDNKLYLLSASANKIWRSVQFGSAFSVPSAYNVKTQLPTNSVAFTIDGKVYVATSDGILQRYFGGTLDSVPNIPIKGLNTQFSGDVKLVTVSSRTDSSTDFLYIMDPGNMRILKVNKSTMTLDSQFEYRGDKNLFKNLKSISLSSDEKTLYALDSDYIFKLKVSE